MYLIDTNIWLERLLDQKRSQEVGQFLDQVPSERLYMSDFTLHSIGIIMSRHKQSETFLSFIQDVFIVGAVVLVQLYPEDMSHLVDTMEQFSLDFDDAYQHAIAERYDLTLVSFDQHFDHTMRGRRTPGELLDHDFDYSDKGANND
jgi:uncharacterized protein